MAIKPKVVCRHPGCPELADSRIGFCPKHTPVVISAAQRGYGKAWQKVRKVFLAAHPLCEECKKNGRYVKATDVDHIKPHRGDRDLFWDMSNWQALCHSCHSKKTAREDLHPKY